MPSTTGFGFRKQSRGRQCIYVTGVATDGVKVQFGEDALNGFNEEKFIVDNIRYVIVNNANTFTFDQISDAVALRA